MINNATKTKKQPRRSLPQLGEGGEFRTHHRKENTRKSATADRRLGAPMDRGCSMQQDFKQRDTESMLCAIGNIIATLRNADNF